MVHAVKTFLFVCLIGVFCSSCSIFLINDSTINHNQNKSELIQLIDHMDKVSQLGILVVDRESGDIIIDHRSDKLFTPASNLKILTALVAVETLSEDFRFKTQFIIPNQSDDENLSWLLVKGSGDPSFSVLDLESIAQLISQNFTSVDTLIVDPTIYDDYLYGPGWMWDEGSYRYSAPVSGINLNWNTVDLIITDNPPIVQVYPNTNYVNISSDLTITADSADYKPIKAERNWLDHTNDIHISGSVFFEDLPETLQVNIEDPATYFSMVFNEMLTAQNVKVKQVKISSGNDGKVYLEHDSENLISLLDQLLKETDNLVAETLIKQLSVSDSTKGSWDLSLSVVREFAFHSIGIDSNSYKIADGSGLSRYNLMSPSQLVKILKYISSSDKTYNTIYNALPQSGIDGTLKDRMTKSDMLGKVTAKTGSLGGINNLSGFIQTDSGRELIFSIMMNNYTIPRDSVLKMQDELCQFLIKS